MVRLLTTPDCITLGQNWWLSPGRAHCLLLCSKTLKVSFCFRTVITSDHWNLDGIQHCALTLRQNLKKLAFVLEQWKLQITEILLMASSTVFHMLRLIWTRSQIDKIAIKKIKMVSRDKYNLGIIQSVHENWNHCRLLFLSVQKCSAAGGDQDKDFSSSVRHVLLQHGRGVAGHAPPALDWQNSTVWADRRLPASGQPWQKECSCWGFLRLLVVVLYVLSSTVSHRNILNHWNRTDVKDECVVAAWFFVFLFFICDECRLVCG